MKVESLSAYNGGFVGAVHHEGARIGIVRVWRGQISYMPDSRSDQIVKWRGWINTVEQLERLLDSNADEILAVSK